MHLQPCLSGQSSQVHNVEQKSGRPRLGSTQNPGQCLAIWPGTRNLEGANDRGVRKVVQRREADRRRGLCPEAEHLLAHVSVIRVHCRRALNRQVGM